METGGLRTWSRITIEVDVAHDVDLHALEERLALEAERVALATADVTLMDLSAWTTLRDHARSSASPQHDENG